MNELLDFSNRNAQLGASDVPALLNLSPWRSEWELWAEKRGMLEPWKGNVATKAGLDLEPYILDYAEADLGQQLDRQVQVGHATLPLMATCDGIVLYGGEPVEAKTSGITGPLYGVWGPQDTDEVPNYYLVQVHCQLMCTMADVAYLYALLAGRGIVRYVIESDSEIAERIGDQITDWWQAHIIDGVAPSMDGVTIDVLKRVKRTSERVELTDRDLRMVELREQFGEARKKADKELEVIDTELLKSLGESDEGELPDGRLVTYKQQTRKAYSVEESKYRVLRITKGKQ